MPKVKRGPKGHDANELAAAKQEVARLIGTGETVKNAMAAVDRTPKAYEVWRAKDPEFRAAIERVRRGVTEEVKAKREGDFPTFAEFS